MIDRGIRVRRVQPGDAAAIARFYAGLSPASRVLRFHAASTGVSDEEARRLADADHLHRDGFVAVQGSSIVGHVALEGLAPGIEEVAVAVDDHLQHHGIGTLLMAAAFASARLRGITTLVGWVMHANGAMHHIFRAAHHPWRVSWEGGVARYEIDVPAGRLAGRRAA